MTGVPFSKVLIANRGEIALRVARTARTLGYRTVAVYSDADRDALHVEGADQAVPIGPAPPRDSYLSVPRLIAAARRSGADAVHPGYGFLAEAPGFAQACRDAGLVFIGPDPEVIRLMGHKTQAKERMREAGVPTVPGGVADSQDLAALAAKAQEVGFPLLVKAAAGGGGRGMRRVGAAGELAAALEGARSEAEAAFASGELFLERLVAGARHVEVQVFGDHQGQVIHLGERDCSLQRRHQKVVEEAPSPAVDEELRREMGQAAVTAARAVGYVGAGTVEFLLDAEGRFYFLEMNTRLQVEHPVTEAVTGLDLVEWQLRIAAGEPLPCSQEEVRIEGHAMEARLYAEDPWADFLPQAGPVHRWKPPQVPGVRVDHGLRDGSTVSPFYDPMVAKVMARGDSRELARRRLLLALEECVLLGPKTNKGFLLEVLRHPVFVEGLATTTFIEETFLAEPRATDEPSPLQKALAAILLSEGEESRDPRTLWGWRSSGAATWDVRVTWEGGAVRVGLELDAEGGYQARIGEGVLTLRVLEKAPGEVRFLADGLQEKAAWHWDGEELRLEAGGASHVFSRYSPRSGAGGETTGRLHAPMSARVVSVRTAVGERVETGQCLVVLEAMKLESRVLADGRGIVEEVRVKEGDQVSHRQLLVVLQPEAGESPGTGG